MEHGPPPAQPVAALSAPVQVPLVASLTNLDDDTALALRRALLVVERRWQRPLSWLLLAIPASCTGLVAGGVESAVAPLALLFALVYGASLVVLPLTTGLLREECAQLGVSPRLLRRLRRLGLAANDERFLTELHAAQARDLEPS